jgi:hypothetical protein
MMEFENSKSMASVYSVGILPVPSHVEDKSARDHLYEREQKRAELAFINLLS